MDLKNKKTAIDPQVGYNSFGALIIGCVLSAIIVTKDVVENKRFFAIFARMSRDYRTAFLVDFYYGGVRPSMSKEAGGR